MKDTDPKKIATTQTTAPSTSAQTTHNETSTTQKTSHTASTMQTKTSPADASSAANLEFRERMKARREELNYSYKKLEHLTGISASTLHRYETGATSGIPLLNVQNILRALELDAKPLIKSDECAKRTIIPPGFEPLPVMVKRPLVGQIACGEPTLAEQNITEYLDVPEYLHVDFCLRCHGDSMKDANILDRDIVYIRVQPDVENGEIAAVRIGEEATLKRVYKDLEHQSITLMPANVCYAPRTFSGEALNEIQIEGKAVGVMHWL